MMHVGLLGFILTIALGLSTTPASAAVNAFLDTLPGEDILSINNAGDEVEVQAVSKRFGAYEQYFGPNKPPKRYYYNKLGYRGWLTLYLSKSGDGRNWTGVYSGTVTCEGTCAMTTEVPLDKK